MDGLDKCRAQTTEDIEFNIQPRMPMSLTIPVKPVLEGISIYIVAHSNKTSSMIQILEVAERLKFE